MYFKVYKRQLSIVEKALGTAGLMLGCDKSRGYCLEMICADFLAGANLSEDEAPPSEWPRIPNQRIREIDHGEATSVEVGPGEVSCAAIAGTEA